MRRFQLITWLIYSYKVSGKNSKNSNLVSALRKLELFTATQDKNKKIELRLYRMHEHVSGYTDPNIVDTNRTALWCGTK